MTSDLFRKIASIAETGVRDIGVIAERTGARPSTVRKYLGSAEMRQHIAAHTRARTLADGKATSGTAASGKAASGKATGGARGDDILRRLREIKPGERVTYHRGDLANDRACDVAVECIAHAAFEASRKGLCCLAQRRAGDGVFDYIAVGLHKRPRPGTIHREAMRA